MLRVKGSDTLCPVGPTLVTDWDFHHKRIRTIVNGEVRQDGNTDEMTWDMHYLVADLARTITLLPGDMIFSGTPAYSRPVQPGDVVTVEVEGLGELTNTIVTGPTPIRDDVGHQPTESGRHDLLALGRLGADVVADRGRAGDDGVARVRPAPRPRPSRRRRAGPGGCSRACPRGSCRPGSSVIVPGDVGDEVVHVPDHLVGVAVLATSPLTSVRIRLSWKSQSVTSAGPDAGRACRCPSRAASSRRRCRGSRAGRSRCRSCSRRCSRPPRPGSTLRHGAPITMTTSPS